MEAKKDDRAFSFMDMLIAIFLGGIVGVLIMAILMMTIR